MCKLLLSLLFLMLHFFPLLKDVSLGGWTLERAVGSSLPVVYKFTPKYVLKSGSYVTVSDKQSLKFVIFTYWYSL